MSSLRVVLSPFGFGQVGAKSMLQSTVELDLGSTEQEQQSVRSVAMVGILLAHWTHSSVEQSMSCPPTRNGPTAGLVGNVILIKVIWVVDGLVKAEGSAVVAAVLNGVMGDMPSR